VHQVGDQTNVKIS